MAIKAKLRVVLMADEVQIAEADDQRLWHDVLRVISGQSSELAETKAGAKPSKSSTSDGADANLNPPADGKAISELAAEVGVDATVIQGACDPQLEAPYLTLDEHNWSAWKRNVPSRGPAAVSDAALAATLLILWCRKCKLPGPSLKDSQKILANLGVAGQNPTRSIRNCRWLQLRGQSELQLNPSRIADAVEVFRAFCANESPKLR